MATWNGASLSDISNGVNDSHNGTGRRSGSESPSGTCEPSMLSAPSIIVIVTNVPDPVFESHEAKSKFEELFLKYGDNMQFQYLKCFRRARVVFETTDSALQAQTNLHNMEVHGQPIKCYFAQSPVCGSPSSQHLQPPEPDKQFLISPPASPPVGWEVISEREPYVNYDLIAAIARLGPGTSYELHPASQDHPAIIVHVCEDPVGFGTHPKIVQTRRPPTAAMDRTS